MAVVRVGREPWVSWNVLKWVLALTEVLSGAVLLLPRRIFAGIFRNLQGILGIYRDSIYIL